MAHTLDHVPFAWSDHDAVVAEFERLGLAPDYGGVHGHGGTEMSVLGFDDRSYVELIAPRDAGGDSDHWLWPDHLRADGGPAAWCVRVPDIAREAKRAIDAGRPVDGPAAGSRERSDGRLVEWDRVAVGRPGRRLLYPFAIADRTPLDHRVPTSRSVAGGPLTGVGEVVLAARDPDAVADSFRDLYRFPRPVERAVPGFGPVASFPGRPVAVAGDGPGWLDDRLDRFRPGPCACLLATDDLAAARAAHPLGEPVDWPGDRRVAFFESDAFGRRLGVIQRA